MLTDSRDCNGDSCGRCRQLWSAGLAAKPKLCALGILAALIDVQLSDISMASQESDVAAIGEAILLAGSHAAIR